MRGFRKDAVAKMNLQMPGHGTGQRNGHQEQLAGTAHREKSRSRSGRTAAIAGRTCAASATAGGTCASCSCAARASCSSCPACCCWLFGLLAIPAVVPGRLRRLERAFGPNFMYTASLAVLDRLPCPRVRLPGKTRTLTRLDPVFFDQRIERLTRWFRIERGFLVGRQPDRRLRASRGPRFDSLAANC